MISTPSCRRRGLLKFLGLLPLTVFGGSGASTHPAASARPARLEYWYTLTRKPVTGTPNPVTRTLLDAARSGRAVSFFYHGGSSPGVLRKIHPEFIFTTSGGSSVPYVTGYCHLRGAPRAFRVDRISLA